MIMMTITYASVMLAEELRVARRGNTKLIIALSETRIKDRHRKIHIENLRSTLL